MEMSFTKILFIIKNFVLLILKLKISKLLYENNVILNSFANNVTLFLKSI